MIRTELMTVAKVLQKLGYAPAYVFAATKMLPQLFPSLTLQFCAGLVILRDIRGHRTRGIVTNWHESADGQIVDFGLPLLGRKVGFRSRMPTVVMDDPATIRRRFQVCYLPDSPELQARLSPEALQDLTSLGLTRAIGAEGDEIKNFLIALRDEGIDIRGQRVSVSVPESLRARAAALRPVSREFERRDRRKLANLIGQEIRISGVVGQIEGTRRCLLGVIDTRTGAELDDHIWVNSGIGNPGSRLTLTGTVYRYRSQRGTDFALRDLHHIVETETIFSLDRHDQAITSKDAA